MTLDPQAALRCVLEDDARALASLMRARRGSRDDRREARAWLGVVFQTLEREAAVDAAAEPAAEPPVEPPTDLPSGPPADVREGPGERAAETGQSLSQVAHTTARWIRRLSGPPALGPLRDLWIRVPFPERFMRPVTATRAQRLADACAGHYHLELALNDERVTWMESRCQAADPGMLRPMRQPSSDTNERLSGSELELLRKRGRSKFS